MPRVPGLGSSDDVWAGRLYGVHGLRAKGGEDTSLKEMTGTLACRGPDASATWHEESAGLGHTRLAVVDLAGGRQPLVLTRGGRTDLAVVFTGEVYNHAQLRTELTARGHRFATRGDGEVVLRAVDAWGEQAPARLEGMFAYAAWEPGVRRLTLVRDRLGIKPLCYARGGDGVVFGSEPKAVLAHPAVEARLDLDGLRELLLSAHPMIKTPGRSAFAGLHEVQPGTLTVFTPAGVRSHRYWSLPPTEHHDDLPTTVARVRSLLEEAVTGQLAADVPVSVLLSGGLDSSAIAALARPAAETLHTLSVDLGTSAPGQDDAMGRDPDGPYAELMVRHLGSSHRRVRLDARSLADLALRAQAGRLRDGLTMGDFDTSLLQLRTRPDRRGPARHRPGGPRPRRRPYLDGTPRRHPGRDGRLLDPRAPGEPPHRTPARNGRTLLLVRLRQRRRR